MYDVERQCLTLTLLDYEMFSADDEIGRYSEAGRGGAGRSGRVGIWLMLL